MIDVEVQLVSQLGAKACFSSRWFKCRIKALAYEKLSYFVPLVDLLSSDFSSL